MKKTKQQAEELRGEPERNGEVRSTESSREPYSDEVRKQAPGSGALGSHE